MHPVSLIGAYADRRMSCAHVWCAPAERMTIEGCAHADRRMCTCNAVEDVHMQWCEPVWAVHVSHLLGIDNDDHGLVRVEAGRSVGGGWPRVEGELNARGQQRGPPGKSDVRCKV